MMRPGTYNITLCQGTTLRQSFIWMQANGTDPVDLTGFTARSQIRKMKDASGPPVLDLSTSNGGIILGGASGKLTLYATPNQTDLLTADKYVYDIEITEPGGDVHRIIEGCVMVSKGVTR